MSRTVYIDYDFKCYTTDNGRMSAVNTEYFNDKCDDYIEGFMFIPANERWIREDGIIFEGEMIIPWKPYDELDQAQRKYEQELALAARILLGGN